MATMDILCRFEPITCGKCGVLFALEVDHVAALRKSGETFYCPNGHARAWTGEMEKLRNELEAARRSRDEARAAHVVAVGERERAERALKRVVRRVAKAVCPCCKRSFGEKKLAQHIAEKHPEFAK